MKEKIVIVHEMIEKTINHDHFATILNRLTLSHEFPKPDLCVVQLDESTNMLIISYGPDSEEKGEASSIKLRAAWGAKNLTPKAINAFNRKFRFVKAYLDHESDPVLESDLLIEGSSLLCVQNTIKKFIEKVNTFETFMALAEEFDMNIN